VHDIAVIAVALLSFGAIPVALLAFAASGLQRLVD
jgi:hypothetical protein